MAKLYALPGGQVWQFFATSQDAQARTPDPAATVVFEFDESANSPLVEDLQLNWAAYTLPVVNGSPQLQKNGAAVAIAAQSALFPLQSGILAGFPDATLKAAIVALWNGTATAAQQQKALAYCLLKLRQAAII